MKQSAKRRSRPNENEEAKVENSSGKKSKKKYLENNQRMREEFMVMKDQIDDLMNYKQLVMHLHNEGMIDNEGRPQVAGPIS